MEGPQQQCRVRMCACAALCSLAFVLFFAATAQAASRNPADPASWPCTSEAEKPGFLPERAPTHISIMVARYESLGCALAGYRKTRVPMVAKWNGEWTTAEYADDAGIYFVVPWIAVHLGLELNRSIEVFFVAVVAAAGLAGIAGFFLLGRHWLARTIAVIGYLLLAVVCVFAGDVYILLAAVPMAFVPWLLYAGRRASGDAAFLGLLAGLGLVAGAANLVRSHAGTGTVVFAALLLVLGRTSKPSKKALGLALLLLSVAVPQLYFKHVLAQRNAYLQVHQPGFVAGLSSHPFWHSVYIGFGYLGNDYVPKYSDTVANDKVQSVAPGTDFVSPRYEAILRHEVWLLAKHHPMLVLTTIFAKLGVIVAMIVAYANIGLWAAWKRPKDRAVEAAFWAAIAFDSLFGILVVPRATYLLGLVAFAALYGIASIDHALCCGEHEDMVSPAKRRGQAAGSVPAEAVLSGTRVV